MKKESIVNVVVALVVGFAAGYLINAAVHESTGHDDKHSDMSHSDEASHSHSEMMFEVSADEAPAIDLVVVPDAKSGYNVSITTERFVFTPDAVNGENIVGEGHAHLYVNDEKIARVYGPDFHYNGTFEGSAEFRVTLNGNDHSEYAVDGSVIEATQTVTAE